MRQKLQFILCADDYGATEAVSRGILEAAAAGRISCASALCTLPDWPRAARAWTTDVWSDAPADLGLHVNLTLGAPCGAMPIFAPSGALPSIGALTVGALRGVLPLKEIEAEIMRQIDVFCNEFGRPPSHIDGHQHAHILPGVRRALFLALEKQGLGPLLIRNSADRFSRIARRKKFVVKATQVSILGQGFRQCVNAAGFYANDGFSGFSDFRPGADYGNAFRSYLIAPGARPLIMCHPGHVDQALRRLDPVTDTRESELRFLLSSQFKEILDESGAGLIRPSECAPLTMGAR